MPTPIVFLIGCTGCGKGSLARKLAGRVGAEIVSIDSMKVYRRMDIGTAKPSAQAQRAVPHHMIDIAEPSDEFSVAQYVSAADTVIADIQARGKTPIVVGGTALYMKSLTEGLFEGPGADETIRETLRAQAAESGSGALHAELLKVDPIAADRIHPNDLRRLVRALEVYQLTGTPISTLQSQWDRDRTRHDCVFVGLRRDLEDQNRRTNARVKAMMEAGLVSEVQSLLAEPQPLSSTARKGLGYAEILRQLRGEISLAEATELIKINTRQFAKGQRTWFKRFRGTSWIDVLPDDTAEGLADRLMDFEGMPWSASPK